MAHLGFVVPPWIGHLNPMTVLARAVAARGHRVSVISFADSEPVVQRAGLDFVAFGARDWPAGTWTRRTEALSQLHGDRGSRNTLAMIAAQAQTIVDELPDVLRTLALDGLVIDQVSVGAETVARVLELPLAIACNALPVHREPAVPTFNRTWPYRDAWWARLRNRAGNAHNILSAVPVLRIVRRFMRAHRLPNPTLRDFNEIPPSLVQVTQIPDFFDFPRRALPDHFHYTGPWHQHADADAHASAARAAARDHFPWTRLDGRPLIYASVGTMQNGVEEVFRTIAAACAPLDAQLVIGLGRRRPSTNENSASNAWPGNPIVVEYAPQLELLARASLVITHAGLNTALESLRSGVPMVCLPITNDQPGVAARLQHLGVAEVLPIWRLTEDGLRDRVRRVLGEQAYRQRAESSRDRMRTIDGPALAARIVEEALLERRRVTAAAQSSGR